LRFTAVLARLQGRTESTGDYTTYRWLELGTLSLPPGRSKIIVRPAGKFVFGLMNLRELALSPARQGA
jgi:hypothetical protein